MLGGIWIQHIEEKGIWAEPLKAYGMCKARIIIDFEKHKILGVEQMSSKGINFVRCYYRSIGSASQQILDMPYLPDDRAIVETELIPFLRSKIATKLSPVTAP